ncbi:hypothetical protein BDQ17DRAFT_593108 [Cyathus striatus]|nr:hypothetical protein BDQ17DRAFT_593108 [Cyathus striatus]
MIPEGKKILQKKRHTKPCKYFQVDKCPLQAEVCDFAHVMAVPAVSQSRPPCRYYLAGSCNNGLSCRYRHGEEGT